jgi:hypothetical protein
MSVIQIGYRYRFDCVCKSESVVKEGPPKKTAKKELEAFYKDESPSWRPKKKYMQSC